MGVQPFHGKASHPLLLAGSPDTSAEITVTSTPNSLNYCVIFIVYTQFTNVAAGPTVQPGGMHEDHGPQVGSTAKVITSIILVLDLKRNYPLNFNDKPNLKTTY